MKPFLLTACLALAATGAFAADTSVTDPVDAQVIKADGSAAEPVAERWGGAYAGVSIGAGFLYDTLKATGQNITGGGYAGYNVQYGNFVAGVEVGAFSAPIVFTDGSGVQSKAFYEARIRAGWGNDKWLAYGSIGAQHATSNLVIAPGADPVKDTALQLGGGVEYGFTSKISTGVDYTWSNYKNFGGSGIGVTVQKVQARLSYTFN